MMVHRLGSLLPIYLGVTVTEPTNGLLWNVLRFAQLPGEEHGAGHVLDHHRGLDRGSGVRPDGEHAVLFQQDGRRIPDALHYLAAYLLSPDGREAATGDRSAKLVGDGCQTDGDGLAHGGEGGGVRGMGVHDAAHIGPMAVDVEM